MTLRVDMGSVKKNSSQLVMDVIRWDSPISRIDIASKTGLSLASVSRAVSKLMEEHYIEEIRPDSYFNGMGRKSLLLRLKERVMFAAGVEYDGEQLKIAVIDEKGEPLITKEQDLLIKNYSPADIASFMYQQICDLTAELDIPLTRLYGIGVGIPGIIDYKKGIIIFSSQLGWSNIHFKEILEQVSGKNCMIENDLKAGLYGEYIYGAAKGSQVAIIISIGSGIGSAVIVEGRLFRGATNSAGEIGHITQDVNGSVCKCGKLGCLQTNIAKSFLLDEAKRVSKIETLHEFMLEVSNNKQWAKRLSDKLVTHAAIAIDTAVCVFNPDTVILCGEIVDEYPFIYKEICRVFKNQYLWDYLKDTFQIYNSSFKGFGCAVGAGALIQDGYYLMV